MADERSKLTFVDIGVLMGSASPQVFEEMVDNYPGCRRILDAIDQMGCSCGHPMCTQKTFQFMLSQGSGNDKLLAGQLIDKLIAQEELTFELVREIQYNFYVENVAKDEEPYDLLKALRLLGS